MARMQTSEFLGFGQTLDMAQVVRVNEFAMPVEVCNSSDGNCHAREGGIAEMKPANVDVCHLARISKSVSGRTGCRSAFDVANWASHLTPPPCPMSWES